VAAESLLDRVALDLHELYLVPGGPGS
jgi:hypothetical protein